MATHRSAEKRHRQSLKRRDRNKQAFGAIASAKKKVLTLARDKANKGDVQMALRTAVRLIDKALVHGQLHKKTAARQISRLTKQVNAAA